MSDRSDQSSSPASATVNALRAAAERGDGDAVAELLAPEVIFHSPMTTRVAFEGREMTIFVRPLPGLATLFATLPPRVSTRRRGRPLGVLAGILTRPLAVVLQTADRLVPKFL